MLVRRVWPARPTAESAYPNLDQLRQMLHLFDPAGADASGEPAAGVFPPINVTQDDDNFYVRADPAPSTRRPSTSSRTTARSRSSPTCRASMRRT
jgi:hypothetical protein